MVSFWLVILILWSWLLVFGGCLSRSGIEGGERKKYLSSSFNHYLLCLITEEKFSYHYQLVETVWFLLSEFEIDIVLGSVWLLRIDSS